MVNWMISVILTGERRFGVSASCKRVEINGMAVGPFENGKIVLMGV
jgi:hypothetical protein